jgi:hypothetical protein
VFPISFDYSGLSEKLYPFAETRDILDIRIGILTLREKWDFLFKKNSGPRPKEDKNPRPPEEGGDKPPSGEQQQA